MNNLKYQKIKMLNLPSVTLTSVIGKPKYFEETIKAILISMSKCDFRKIKVLSCVRFNHSKIECIQIPELSYEEYNKFMIEEYDNYFDSGHILHVQDDGFIIKPEYWNFEFLKYDYIGSLWLEDIHDDPPVLKNSRVGNGGFTLRSKQLISILKNHFKYPVGEFSKKWNKPYNEDALICRKWKKELEELGIEFAPNEIASQFSIEYERQKEYEGQTFSDFNSLKTFGFHNSKFKFT
jgi:hypothetical protein